MPVIARTLVSKRFHDRLRRSSRHRASWPPTGESTWRRCAVGEEVDAAVVGIHQEDIVVGRGERGLPLLPVVSFKGSVILIRNGSMMVRMVHLMGTCGTGRRLAGTAPTVHPRVPPPAPGGGDAGRHGRRSAWAAPRTSAGLARA